MASNAAVAALLKPTKQVGRNPFPLDNKHTYSIKAGNISPIKAIHYEPDSFFKLQVHDFTMTFPMQTAPFLRARKETSLYSVYYNAIWSLYNQYQGTRSDPKTSAFGNDPKLVEPRYPLIQFYGAVLSQWFHYFFYTYYIDFYVNHTYSDSEDSLRETMRNRIKRAYFGTSIETPWEIVVPYLGPDNTTISMELQLPVSYSSFYSGCNFYDVQRGSGIFTGESPITAEQYSCDVVGHFRCYNWIRKADMLGYGNIYPLVNKYEELLISALDSTDSVLDFATLWRIYVPELEKILFDSVVTYDASITEPITPYRSDVVQKMFNLYSICAYNSVFYHFFRNSYYDLNYYTHDYSLDFVSVHDGFGEFNIVRNNDFSLRFWDIEYHQWKKDTFTAVLPDTQFGAVSSVNFSSVVSVDGADISGRALTAFGGKIMASTVLSNGSAPVGWNDAYTTLSGNGTGSFDVIALKRAEMLQDYRQQLMRAGNRTSDVFKAIYGKAPSSEHEDDVIPRFLETFGEDIFVDPVQATANTGDSNPNGQLGDIAARGKFRGDSPEIEFNAGGNFGVIVAFTYVVPTAEYNSYMFDKHNMELTPEDHYIPNFENLGLEPIMSDELNCLLPANDIHVLGYGPRYYHKKSEVDMVHGAFCSLPQWFTNFHLKETGWFGVFNNWVSPRSDMQNRSTTLLRDFYINPSVLDNIFVRAAGADQADDQFLCNTLIECDSVKGMSKTGLINFV